MCQHTPPMDSSRIQQLIEQVSSIKEELSSVRPEQLGPSEGAAWLRRRMLERAVGHLKKAVSELESYRQPDDALDDFGRNLKTLEENAH